MPESAPPMSLVLKGPLTMRTSDTIYRSLCQAVAEHVSIEIDAQGAEEIDLSFIQMLIAAQKSARAVSKTVFLAGPAHGVVLETLNRAGFAPISTDPSEPDPVKANAFWFEPATP